MTVDLSRMTGLTCQDLLYQPDHVRTDLRDNRLHAQAKSPEDPTDNVETED